MKIRPKHVLFTIVMAVVVYMTYIEPLAMLIIFGVFSAVFGLVCLILATTEDSWNPMDW